MIHGKPLCSEKQLIKNRTHWISDCISPAFKYKSNAYWIYEGGINLGIYKINDGWVSLLSFFALFTIVPSLIYLLSEFYFNSEVANCQRTVAFVLVPIILIFTAIFQFLLKGICVGPFNFDKLLLGCR